MFLSPFPWLDFLRTREFVFGSRIHGNLAGVMAGTPTLVLTSYLGAGFRFRGGTEQVTTTLSRPDDGRTSDSIQWRVTPGEWTYVATTAQLADLAVIFDGGGDYTICFED